MLGRAAQCLDSGAKTPWRGAVRAVRPRKNPPSRRQLHYAFWRHAACDLDLPTYYFETLGNLFEPLHITTTSSINSIGGSSNVSPSQRRNAAHDPLLFLDFLYPPQAQALLRRLASQSRRRWAGQSPLSKPDLTPRSYTSISKPVSQEASSRFLSEDDELGDEEEVDNEDADVGITTEGAEEGDAPTNAQPVNLSQRLSLLLRNESGRPVEELADDTWQAYELLADQRRRARVRGQVLLFLAGSSRMIDAHRIVRIFNTIPDQERSTEVASQAILALLKVGNPQLAFDTHNAFLRGHPLDIPAFKATEDLLLNRIAKVDWRQVFDMWEARRSAHIAKELFVKDFDSWRSVLKGKLERLPGYTKIMTNLIEFLDANGEILEMSGADGLTLDLITSYFNHPENVARGSINDTLGMLRQLRNLGLSRATFYDKACLACLSGDGPIRQRLHKSALIYWDFRKDSEFSPRRVLLEPLLHHAVEAGNESFIDLLMDDWRRFYGAPTAKLAISIMRWYASQANVGKVEAVIAEYTKSHTPAHVGFFYPVLHADAIRSGPNAVKHRLRSIKDEFSIIPDLTCWNILLHAYARYNDLDGALEGLAKLIEAGHSPDTYTLGTMLSICGRRGGVDLAKEYLRFSVSNDVRVTTAMYDSVVLAYVNDDNFARALKLAEEVTPGNPEAATRMWTQIMAALATRKRYKRALRVSRRMRELWVPFDAPAYAALMRIFTANNQPATALRIMNTLMPRDGVYRAPIHFAILIDGYAKVGKYDTGLRAYARMIKNSMKSDINVRLALLKLQGLAASQNVKLNHKSDMDGRHNVLEELLDEILATDSPNLGAGKGPQILQRELTVSEAQPAAYFDTLLSIYGRTKTFEHVRVLLERYRAKRAELRGDETFRWPLQFLLTLMRVRDGEKDYESVSHFWNLAVETASAKAHTFSPNAGPGTIDGGKSTAGGNQKLMESRSLPSSSRRLLVRHLDIYLRSLSQQRDYPAMLAAINSLREAGFDLDSQNWNTYVQILCQRGFFAEAFELTEQQLIPAWRGFRSQVTLDTESQRRNRDPGMEFMGRPLEWLRQGKLHVTYLTLLRLRRILSDLGDVRAGGLPAVAEPAVLPTAEDTNTDNEASSYEEEVFDDEDTKDEDTITPTSLDNSSPNSIPDESGIEDQPDDPAPPTSHHPLTALQKSQLLKDIYAKAPRTVAASRRLPRATISIAKHIMGPGPTARTIKHEKSIAQARRPEFRDLDFKRPRAEVRGVAKKKVGKRVRAKEKSRQDERRFGDELEGVGGRWWEDGKV